MDDNGVQDEPYEIRKVIDFGPLLVGYSTGDIFIHGRLTDDEGPVASAMRKFLTTGLTG